MTNKTPKTFSLSIFILIETYFKFWLKWSLFGDMVALLVVATAQLTRAHVRDLSLVFVIHFKTAIAHNWLQLTLFHMRRFRFFLFSDSCLLTKQRAQRANIREKNYCTFSSQIHLVTILFILWFVAKNGGALHAKMVSIFRSESDFLFWSFKLKLCIFVRMTNFQL